MLSKTLDKLFHSKESKNRLVKYLHRIAVIYWVYLMLKRIFGKRKETEGVNA